MKREHVGVRSVPCLRSILATSLVAIATFVVAPGTAEAVYEQEAFDASVEALYQSYYAWAIDGGGEAESYHYYSYYYTYCGYYYCASAYYYDHWPAFDSAAFFFQYGGSLADVLLIYYDAGNTTYVARANIVEAGTYSYAAYAWGLHGTN